MLVRRTVQIDANTISFFPQKSSGQDPNICKFCKITFLVWELIKESGYTFEVCNSYTF